MSRSLRVRHFGWLTVVLVAYYLVYLSALFAYNRYEMTELGHDPQEEFEEFLALTSLGLVTLPLVIAFAWFVSSRMLRPLRAIADTAQRIGQGSLTERIPVPDSGDELSSLSSTLNAAFDRFHEAVRRLEQFASDASHQLRNPLLGLRGTGEIALQKERPAGEYRDTIVGMLDEVDRLHRVVSQLLAMARLDAARLRSEFAAHDAGAILRHVLDLRRTQAAARRVTLEDAGDERVIAYGDRTLLMEALANLVDNAIRHSPEGGCVRATARDEGTRACWTIRDDGEGIPAEKLPTLFERFSRGDHGDPGSVGLGLSIASEIAHLHRGSLTASNHPAGGAEFTLRIPSRPDAAAA